MPAAPASATHASRVGVVRDGRLRVREPRTQGVRGSAAFVPPQPHMYVRYSHPPPAPLLTETTSALHGAWSAHPSPTPSTHRSERRTFSSLPPCLPSASPHPLKQMQRINRTSYEYTNIRYSSNIRIIVEYSNIRRIFVESFDGGHRMVELWCVEVMHLQ